MKPLDLRKKQREEQDHYLRTSLVPLIVGLSLIIAKINMIIFKVIGWILLVWGLGTGGLYFYKEHKETILKTLRRLYIIKRKEKEE